MCIYLYVWVTPVLLLHGLSVILSGVSARGNKISHTGGKCVTCSGLTNSREEPTPAFWFNLAEEIVLMLFHIYYANVLIFNKQQFVIKHERPTSSL